MCVAEGLGSQLESGGDFCASGVALLTTLAEFPPVEVLWIRGTD